MFIARAFQRQIRLANLKNDLVGTVSHELKTPLSSMRLLVDTLLEEDRLDTTTTREYLQLIANENSRLSRLIDNFLAFSRMEQNRPVLNFTQLDMCGVIDEAIEAAGERFHSAECCLRTDIAKDLPKFTGDRDAIVTVLLNLLDNAFKYSSPKREIQVHADVDDSNIVIRVQDNGVGLSRIASQRVFERFYQVDQSLAREGKGCGLGLSIVESIVKAHGGSVSVTSELGVGSTFSVRIPCEQTTRP